MTPTDGSAPDHPDFTNADRLAADLAGLRPVDPGPGLRTRIAAELAATGPGSPVLRSRAARGFGERLLWAAGGAVAASLVFLATGDGLRSDAEPARVAAVTGSTVPPAIPAIPATPEARVPRMREEAVGWSDEGIRFVDEFTPARVLRRTVIERHLADDGHAEVHVPREDVIFLPVALR